jgi:hypothetical protein
LPLWADCLWSGYPFHADPQAAVFYPPLWLIYAGLRIQGWGHFPIEALTAEVALHALALSLFTFAFIRSLRLNRFAATFGALAFTYGGYLTGAPPLQPAKFAAITWLPVALLAMRAFAHTRRPRLLALAVVALGVSYLAGHPQTFLHIALLTLSYFAWCARAAGWSWRSLAASAAALTGWTAALGAVQLLPTAQFILSSTRATLPIAQAGGFPFEDLIQFFITGWVSLWHPLYIGILPLGLIAFALAGRISEVRFWAGAAVIALLLSFGDKAGLYEVAYWLIPGWRLFRNQELMALVVSFSLVMVAAFGADGLLRSLSVTQRATLDRVRRAMGALVLSAAALLLTITYLAHLGFNAPTEPSLSNRVAVLLLASALSWMALTLRAHVPALYSLWPAVFVGVLAFDIFAASRPLNIVPAFAPFPARVEVAPIQADTDPFFRVQNDFQLPGHAGCVYGYRGIDGVTPYRLAAYDQLLNAPERERWALLGVRYVVSWRAELFDADGERMPAEVVAVSEAVDAKGNPTRTHRLLSEPQRAWLIPSGASLLQALPAQDLGGVTVLSDQPGDIQLQFTALGDSELIVNDAAFSGWQFSVDGQPQAVTAEALLRAPVPAGTHTARWRYEPPLLLWGAMISGLALLAVLVVWVRGR